MSSSGATSTPLQDEKVRMREAAREAREAAHGEGGDAVAEAVRDRVLAVLAESAPDARVISGYWAVGGEMSLEPLFMDLHASGHTLALPVVIGPGVVLQFRRWVPKLELSQGPLGTVQPPGSQEIVTPDVVVAPLLAFDAEGYRLGQGGGYYDRTIEALRRSGGVLTLGVGFAAQQVERVPHGPFDQQLDYIITEKTVFRTRSGQS